MGSIYKEGQNRKQALLLPPSIDEYVSEDNPVRAIDSYINMLDMAALGFTKADLHALDGQPAYHPGLLLKIYLYGYLNRIRSSRTLAREIERNVEMMWLCAGLKPSYKTIADFRKENSVPLKKVFREFVLLIKNLDLITGDLVAVDGAFLRANASKNQLILKKSIEKDLKKIDEKVDAYLQSLNFADVQEKPEPGLKVPQNKMASLQEKKAQLDQELALLEEKGLTQYNRTDPDAKLMIKPAHNLMAYNVQIAVDSRYKFIAATEVSGEVNDAGKLHTMARAVQEITQNEAQVTVADCGYYSAQEIATCQKDHLEVIVPIPDKQKKQRDQGLYPQDAFTYDARNDRYLCPNDQHLTRSNSVITKSNGTRHFVYRAGSKTCKACPIRDQCLPPKTAYRSIMRSEYAPQVEKHKTKMQTSQAKAIVRQRGALAEHPFGTLKQDLGWSHFLVRGLEKVSGENALNMLVYDFRRLLNLIGVALFQKLIQALCHGNLEAIKKEIAAYIAARIAVLECFMALLWPWGVWMEDQRRKILLWVK